MAQTTRTFRILVSSTFGDPRESATRIRIMCSRACVSCVLNTTVRFKR